MSNPWGYSHGTRWTDEEILRQLNIAIEKTGGTHFPTHKEMEMIFGDKCLSNALARRGGTREWSKRLNLEPLACSNTKKGNIYEKQAITDIKTETGLDSELMRERYPYDIYVNNLVKVDVKVSLPMKGKNFDSWSFHLEKTKPTCDIYIFYCANTNGETIKRFIIPACVVSGQSQVGMGILSKYDNYIERWDLIKDYNDYLLGLKTKIKIIPRRRTVLESS